MKKRRMYDDRFKAKVAIESIKNEKTISELSGIYEIHPNQIRKWKKHVIENLPSVFSFSKRKNTEINELKDREDMLYKQIGKQNIELEYLKKKYNQLSIV